MRWLVPWLALCLVAAAPFDGIPYPANAPSLNCDFTSGVTGASPVGFVNVGPKCPVLTFSRASSQTYFDATGTMQTAGNNVATFDYDPVTLAPKGLQIWEQRTNLFLNSASLSTQTVTVTATSYTLSFYGTGTIVLTGTYSGILSGSGAFPTRSTLTFTPTAGALLATASGTVTDAQIEAGGFVTPYIPTTGASATRAADIAYISVGPWYNPKVGTLIADATLSSINNSNNQEIAGFSDGTVNNLMEVRNQGLLGGDFRSVVFVANLNKGANITSGISANIPFKGGFSYNYSTLATNVMLNGGPLLTGSVSALPPTITTLSLGIIRQNTIDGWVKKLRYYPRMLSASQFQKATQ